MMLQLAVVSELGRRPGGPGVGHKEVETVEIPQYIEAIRREGRRLVEAAKAAGLDAPVPTCPGWDTRDLVRHLGEIHLWAAAWIAYPDAGPQAETEAALLTVLSERWPELGVFWVDDEDLTDWYLRTNANLIEVLEAAPDDFEAVTFWPAPTPRAMWARRQAHETSIHRFDAEAASGGGSGFDATFATDGVDEILGAMTTRRRLDKPVAHPQSMKVHATDTDERWLVTFSSDVATTVRGDGPADVVVTATASDLYLNLWNRIDDQAVDVAGDHGVLDTWHGDFRARFYQVD